VDIQRGIRRKKEREGVVVDMQLIKNSDTHKKEDEAIDAFKEIDSCLTSQNNARKRMTRNWDPRNGDGSD